MGGCCARVKKIIIIIIIHKDGIFWVFHAIFLVLISVRG